MKLRGLLLVGCMIVVPALAMFSHLIPADVRAWARGGLHAATSGLLGTPAVAGMAAAPKTVAHPTAVAGVPGGAAGEPLEPIPPVAMGDAAARATAATVMPSPVPAIARPVAAQAFPAGAQPVPATPSPPPASAPAGPPLVAQLADRARQVRDQQQRDMQQVEARLRAAGAVSFDTDQLPGAEGLVTCSCRVPIDAAGQLQRVFQANGHDPLSASAALLEQVTAWRQRMTAAGNGLPQGDGTDGRSLPGDRFR